MLTPERERRNVIVSAVCATICVGLFAVMLWMLYAEGCRGLPFPCDIRLLFWVTVIVTLPPFLTALWINWRKRAAKQH